MKPKIVEVEWDDARSVYLEMTLEEAPGKCPLVRRFTTGYLVLKDRERIVVAGTYDPANQHDGEGGADFTTIPRGWVKNIVGLEPTAQREET